MILDEHIVREPYGSRFVTIEGVDRAGKSTLVGMATDPFRFPATSEAPAGRGFERRSPTAGARGAVLGEARGYERPRWFARDGVAALRPV